MMDTSRHFVMICVFMVVLSAAALSTAAATTNDNTVASHANVTPLRTDLRPKIVGGSVVTDLAKHPYYVRLEINAGGNSFFLCGGTLISPQVIVTAGHCVSNAGQVLQTGRARPACVDETDTCGSSFVPFSKVDLHPSFNFPAFDIALITLDAPLSLSASIAPIALSSSATPASGTSVQVVGYGGIDNNATQSTVLKELSMSSVTCPFGLGGDICIQDNGSGSCSGDSGGPLVAPPRDAAPYAADVLVGVVSGIEATDGATTCGGTDVTFYTAVAANNYLTWMRSVLPAALCQQVQTASMDDPTTTTPLCAPQCTVDADCPANQVCNSPGVCICDSTHVGPNCGCDTTTCTGNKQCNGDQCVCIVNFTGPNCGCDTVACAAMGANFTCGNTDVCTCASPYSGPQCGCNTATCTSPNHMCQGDSCVCAPGFIGPQCGCNTATCTSPNHVCQGNNCVCAPGYYGVECLPAGSCSRNSDCRHNHVCNLTTHLCECPTGFVGKKCRCNTATCTGNFSCNDSDNCSCRSGFTGSQCLCDVASCAAQGDHFSCNGSNICQCSAGYAGQNCQCDQAACAAKGPNFECDVNGDCACKAGFTGMQCQCSVTACQQRRGPNATCDASGHCVCSGTFTGTHCGCDTSTCNGPNSRCDNNRCECRGRNRDVNNGCACRAGYFTDSAGQCSILCNTSAAPVPGLNVNCFHGHCDGTLTPAPSAGSNICVCDSPSWTGRSCNCSSDPSMPTCLNGGVCNNQGGCTCPIGFSGPNCQFACDCSGHGSCRSDGKCICSGSWEGNRCQCNENITCNGNGSCQRDGSCKCEDRWSGVNCDTCALNYYGPRCNKFCQAGGSSCRNGTCDAVTGNCTCNSGWHGSSCSSCTLACKRGTCKADATTGAAFCLCQTGWTGLLCNVRA